MEKVRLEVGWGDENLGRGQLASFSSPRQGAACLITVETSNPGFYFREISMESFARVVQGKAMRLAD